jgi:hypothetical protein
MAEEKRAAGLDVPVLNWRYILFNWNDTDEEMNLARAMAADIGIDRLCWEITDHPEDSFSRRFAPGTALHGAIQHEIWDDNNLGNAIAGATPRAEIVIHTVLPDLPFFARAGSSLTLATEVRNLSTRPFRAESSQGRRMVRLGAQLLSSEGAMINRDHARAWLPGDLPAGARAVVPIEIPAPASPGRYAIKFDLVSEGIDWFEACGSPTTTRGLWIGGTSP